MAKERPDGSLCRITSSFKDLINNVQIVKVPDSVPSYKLVIIRSNNLEEESEKSSEDETSDDELLDIKLPPKNFEKEKVVDVDTKIAKIDKPKETVADVGMRERNHYNRHQRYNKNNRYYGHRNNYNTTSKKYKNHSDREENYNYGSRGFNSKGNRDYKSTSKRDFSSTAKNHVTYNADNYQHSLQRASDTFPSPWIDPPVIFPNYLRPSISGAALPENPRNSVGLLGDRPSCASSVPTFPSNKQKDNYIHDQNSTYTPMASNFQPDTISANFICDQTSPYPPIASNHNNSFVHNQSSPYSPMTTNYPSSTQTDKFVRDQNYWNGSYNNYSKGNQNRNKQKQNSWNKNSRRHPNVRNNSSRNNVSRNNAGFDYRN